MPRHRRPGRERDPYAAAGSLGEPFAGFRATTQDVFMGPAQGRDDEVGCLTIESAQKGRGSNCAGALQRSGHCGYVPDRSSGNDSVKRSRQGELTYVGAFGLRGDVEAFEFGLDIARRPDDDVEGPCRDRRADARPSPAWCRDAPDLGDHLAREVVVGSCGGVVHDAARERRIFTRCRCRARR